MKKLLTILTLSLLALNAFGQRTVRGTVVDELGEPVIGAAVMVKGGISGTATDLDGNFRLRVPNDDVVLVISSIGFGNREVKISSSGEFTVSSIPNNYPVATSSRSTTQTIGANYDIANSLYGISFTQTFRERFSYGLLAQSNFNNDYVFAGSVGINSPFRQFWRINRLSLNYTHKNLSENIDFNFHTISIKGYTSLWHRHRYLGRLFVEPTFQALNDNSNFGLTLGLNRSFWLRNSWSRGVNVGLSAGYFNDYWTYSAGAHFHISRNFGLRLIYNRIDRYDFFNVGLIYRF